MFTSKISTTIAALTVAGIALAGCQTSYVLVGKVRPPISPDQVVVYLHPPADRYEEIALLDTSSKHSFSFSAQGKTNAVIERLKKESASLGANGIFLNGVGDQASGSVGAGFGSATSNGSTAFGSGFGISDTVFEERRWSGDL
jgi:hypothetical protein